MGRQSNDLEYLSCTERSIAVDTVRLRDAKRGHTYKSVPHDRATPTLRATNAQHRSTHAHTRASASQNEFRHRKFGGDEVSDNKLGNDELSDGKPRDNQLSAYEVSTHKVSAHELRDNELAAFELAAYDHSDDESCDDKLSDVELSAHEFRDNKHSDNELSFRGRASARHRNDSAPQPSRSPSSPPSPSSRIIAAAASSLGRYKSIHNRGLEEQEMDTCERRWATSAAQVRRNTV